MKKNAMMQKKKDVERINKMWSLYRKIIKKLEENMMERIKVVAKKTKSCNKISL